MTDVLQLIAEKQLLQCQSTNEEIRRFAAKIINKLVFEEQKHIRFDPERTNVVAITCSLLISLVNRIPDEGH